MASILYYSNFCEPSQKLLQVLSKEQINGLHYVCIDRRIRENNKMYIILQNGEKILMPDIITRVPSLLLLNDNYRVLYGDQIITHLRPIRQQQVQQATQFNMEPSSFSFDYYNLNGNNNIVSDNYSFLDQSSDELSARGNGGLRQIHNYVSLNDNNRGYNIITPNDEHEYKTNKIKDGELNIETLQRQRDNELNNIVYK
jgi:hypothetical protein